jgi:hypothetical protein
MKSYLTILAKIINWKIILVFLIIFCVSLAPIHFLPDIFNLNSYKEKKDVVLKLLSTLIGFSGLILTVLLVVYNFHLKSIRRNILEFVFDNKWLSLTFTLFFGLLLYLCLSFFFVNTKYDFNDLTALYLCFILTFCFIIALIPLSILTLNESVSLNKIYRIAGKIDAASVEYLSFRTTHNDENFKNIIEKNPILVLKDISLAAIAERDWLLPQTVLNELFNRLILPLTSTSSKFNIQSNLNAWALFCNHIKNEVIKQNDVVTGSVLLFTNLRAHRHFAEQKLIFLRGNPIDTFVIEYMRVIMVEGVFFEMQSYFLRYTSDVIRGYFKEFEYSDDDVPTFSYRLEQRDKTEYKITDKTNYWFYLTKELPDVLFKMVEASIDSKRKNVYDNLSFTVNILLDAIFNEKKLSKHQKEEALMEYMYQAEKISNYAIDNGIYSEADVISHIQIETWLRKDVYLAEYAFYCFIRMIKLLNNKGALSEKYIDELFMIGRVTSNYEINTSKIVELIDSILQTAFEIINQPELDRQVKRDFVYQIRWFKEGYLDVNEKLSGLKTKYQNNLQSVLR